jgi:hypothetical protein
MQINLRTREITLETDDVQTGTRVEPRELPPCINGYNGAVFRLDVAQAEGCPRP